MMPASKNNDTCTFELFRYRILLLRPQHRPIYEPMETCTVKKEGQTAFEQKKI